jgi:hypothetical protein
VTFSFPRMYFSDGGMAIFPKQCKYVLIAGNGVFEEMGTRMELEVSFLRQKSASYFSAHHVTVEKRGRAGKGVLVPQYFLDSHFI